MQSAATRLPQLEHEYAHQKNELTVSQEQLAVLKAQKEQLEKRAALLDK